jgi:two-component system, cell cycle sensor histidine kinase and response regulator CckA
MRQWKTWPTGSPVTLEIEHRRKDGSVFPVQIRTAKIEYGSGQYILALVQDITERVELEERRQQIVKMESLNRMAGAIAHHFNNMLSIVIGNLDLALTDSNRVVMDGEKLVDHLDQAMEGARRAAEMSTFILAYTGQLKNKMEVHDLSEACEAIVAGLKETMPHGIRVVTDFSASPGSPAKVAPDLVRQALTHLITNAREAIEVEEGEIRVSIRTKRGIDILTTSIWPPDWNPDAEEYAAVQVTDTGCGISAENLGKVMDPFFSTKFAGRGIGLAVVLGIVQAHKGAVTVESELGVGSTFQVLFPLADQKITSRRDTAFEAAVSLETERCILLP